MGMTTSRGFTGSIGKGIRLLYKNLIEPRSTEEDSRRRERILNIILVGALTLLSLLDIQLLVRTLELGDTYRGIPFGIFSVIVLFFTGLLFLSRRGYFLAAGYLFLSCYFLAATYGAYRWGADLQSTLLSYAFIIVAASILISTRFSFVMTGIIALTILPLWYLQLNGYLPFERYWTVQPGLSDTLVFSLMLTVIALISWLSNRELERSLERARNSEADLQVERDLLEIKVEERTRELRELQLERMNQLARLAEAGRLAAGMIHDLLNPLTVVALSIEELDRNGRELKDAQIYLENAIQASRRMEDLIAAVRKRMSDGEIRMEFSPTREIQEILTLFFYKAKRAGVSLRFMGEGEIQMFGDSLKFNQIVANLVSNAIDAYDSIPLSESNREVEVQISEKANAIEVIVKDWGIGISAEDVLRIFDPFFTTKEMNKGTGLGLATVKTLIEKSFQGTVAVESDAGKGSVFIVRLLRQTADV